MLYEVVVFVNNRFKQCISVRYTYISVKIGMDLPETFDTIRGLRQGDPVSCDTFNFNMESVLLIAGMHRNGNIFLKKCPVACVR